MMKRNWIFFAFALLALASCSVEKRVYQPGYHIEWNHFAEQDVSQGRSEGVFQGASQDLPQDLSENLETDVSQGRSEGVFQGASQDLPQDLSKNLETDVSQGRSEGVFQDAKQGNTEGASQDLPQDLSENLSKNIDSDLELILYVVLALFLPALTIFLLEGFSKNFWIALLLMVCAFSLPVLAVAVRAILGIIAIILAISVVFRYK